MEVSTASDNSDDFSDSLVCFTTRGNVSYSAALAKSATTDLQYDLLAFLGIAQYFKIDFLPITWQPALDNAGMGGTADICQAPVNLQTSFVFKRLMSAKFANDETKIYRALIAEISVLGHSLIRSHPNIIRLEGICWDVLSKGENVRPVLVFEKTQHGDLRTFMERGVGTRLSFEGRLSLCADIAMAVMDMHSNGFIHGDIKPENVLVFEEVSRRYIAKVADFGYSTLFASNKETVAMPMSPLWTAPEWHHRGFTPGDAMKMDAYSFGRLCLWLLLYNTQDDLSNFDDLLSRRIVALAAFHSFKEIDVEEILSDLCHPPTLAIACLDHTKKNLKQLFDMTLTRDPCKRTSDFRQLLQTIAPHRLQACSQSTPFIMNLPPSFKDFRIVPSIYQLYEADYHVRAHIAASLRGRILELKDGPTRASALDNAAFELAFCYKLGFGVVKDDDESETVLKQSNRQHEELEHEIDLLRRHTSGLSFQEGLFSNLLSQGHGPLLDYRHHYREYSQSHTLEQEYRREISDIETVLHSDHPICSTLKSALASIFMGLERWKEAGELEVQVLATGAKVLEEVHPSTLTKMNNLMMELHSQGKYEAAKVMQVRSVKVLRLDDPSAVTPVNRLALGLQAQGKNSVADQIHRQAVGGSKKALGLEHPSTLVSMSNLGEVLRKQGKYAEAEAMNRLALEGHEKVLGKEHPSTLTDVNNLAVLLRSQGKYEVAEEINRRVLKGYKKVLGLEHPSTLTSMNNLACVLDNQGKYKEASEIHRQLRETVLGKEHPATLTSMNNLAELLMSKGKYMDAEEKHRRALGLHEKVLGSEHPDTLGSMNNLAKALRSQGKYTEAEEMHLQALRLQEIALGPQHPDTLASMNNLALVLGSQGKYKEAEEMHHRTLGRQETVLGLEHPDTLASMNNLALVLGSQGKYKEAEEMHHRTLGRQETVLGLEHPDTLTSVNNLALVLRRQGRYEEAEDMHRRALGILGKALGSEHPGTLMCINNLAVVLRYRRKYNKAEEIHQGVLGLQEKTLGKKHPDTLASMNNLAVVVGMQGRHEEAEDMHRRTLGLQENELGMKHIDTLTSMNDLAVVLRYQWKYKEAEEMNRRAVDGREIVLGKGHPDTLTSVDNLAVVLSKQGKYAEAEEVGRRALDGREMVLGLEHPDTLSSVKNLALVLLSQGKCGEAEELSQRASEL